MGPYWKQNKISLVFTLLMGITASALSAGVSIILQRIIDASLSGNFSAFIKIVVFTAFYMLALCLASWLSSFLTKYLSGKIIREYREDVFRGIMRRSPRDFHKYNTADYISALTNDMNIIEDSYISTMFAGMEYAVMFVFTLLILLAFSPLITGLLILMLLSMFAVPALMGRLLEARQKAVSQQAAVFTEKIKDFFSGFEVIRSYWMYPGVFKRFSCENTKEAAARFQASRLFALNEGISDMLSVFSTVLVIFVSAYLVLKGSITMGTLLALVQLSGTFITPVVLIMQSIPKIQSAKPVIERLNVLAGYETEELSGRGTAELEKQITVENLSFSYSGRSPALENISLTLDSGKKYAVLGHSGCGKSTLARLLTGYTGSYDGNIYYDGTELRALDMASLSSLVTLMHQNVYLFSDSIENNITLYEPCPAERYQQAVSSSGIGDFHSQLPDGWDSHVGENGSLLSGGQKQRVSLARALIRRPKLLILDEGTSAVDMQTAMEIEKKLLGEASLTLLTITHTISKELLKEYDEIILMDGGRLIAKGPFEVLLKNCAYFKKLFE